MYKKGDLVVVMNNEDYPGAKVGEILRVLEVTGTNYKIVICQRNNGEASLFLREDEIELYCPSPEAQFWREANNETNAK